MPDHPPEEKWPSVGLAYEFVQPSYGWALDRVNSANRRIHQLQAFAATVTFAVPVLADSFVTNLTFQSGWLYLALGMFVLTIGLGIFAVWAGTIRLLNPGELYRYHLHKKPWEFKVDLVYRAGEALKHNGKLISQKWTIAVAMTVAFAVELVSLALWILTV